MSGGVKDGDVSNRDELTRPAVMKILLWIVSRRCPRSGGLGRTSCSMAGMRIRTRGHSAHSSRQVLASLPKNRKIRLGAWPSHLGTARTVHVCHTSYSSRINSLGVVPLLSSVAIFRGHALLAYNDSDCACTTVMSRYS